MSAQVEDAIRAKDHYTRQEIIAIRFPSNYPSIELHIHPIVVFCSLPAASNITFWNGKYMSSFSSTHPIVRELRCSFFRAEL